MKRNTISIVAILGVVLIIIIWLVSAYNGLVQKDEACSQQWSKVESQYQRRLDLIPNLVNINYLLQKETLQKFKQTKQCKVAI